MDWLDLLVKVVVVIAAVSAIAFITDYSIRRECEMYGKRILVTGVTIHCEVLK